MSEKSDATAELQDAVAHWKTQLTQANAKLEEPEVYAGLLRGSRLEILFSC